MSLVNRVLNKLGIRTKNSPILLIASIDKSADNNAVDINVESIDERGVSTVNHFTRDYDCLMLNLPSLIKEKRIKGGRVLMHNGNYINSNMSHTALINEAKNKGLEGYNIITLPY